MANYLVTGGAGFIGVNSAKYFTEQGWDITIVDDLSRRGTDSNLEWLKAQTKIDFHKLDIRDHEALARVVGDTKPDALLHLAGQVAVTTSVVDPREDFEINAYGTFNVLEAVRLKTITRASTIYIPPHSVSPVFTGPGSSASKTRAGWHGLPASNICTEWCENTHFMGKRE